MINNQVSKFILNQERMSEFFNDHSQKIFGANKNIKIINIKRSHTFNIETYNILYSLNVDDKRINIRASYSTQADRGVNYQILSYLFNHGFNKGNILVARPYVFFPEYNIIFYENIPGQTFMYELNDNLDNLQDRMKIIAQAIKKIHALPIPSFALWPQIWDVNQSAISQYYPNLAMEIDKIQQNIFQELKKTKSKSLCHGDFQPNNLIFYKNNLYLIDFGSVCVSDKELDVASFVIQLKIMLKKFGNILNFEPLKENFLSEYGEFDIKKFNLYSILLSLRILDFFIVFPKAENNQERIPFGYQLVKENLERIGIKIDDA